VNGPGLGRVCGTRLAGGRQGRPVRSWAASGGVGRFLVRPRVWAGPRGSAGAPPGDRRSRHRRGQAGPTPQTGRRGHRVIPGLRRVDGEGCERRPNVASGIPVPTFRGVRQLRSMRLGCQNRRLSNHTGRLTQLPIFRSTECLSDVVGLSPLTQSGARRTVGFWDSRAVREASHQEFWPWCCQYLLSARAGGR